MNSGNRLAVTLFVLVQFFLVSSLLAQNTTRVKHAAEAKLSLHDGWSLQTSAKVEAKGEVISTPQFSTQGWHEGTVPTTVVAALVKDKTFPAPLFGMNLRDWFGPEDSTIRSARIFPTSRWRPTARMRCRGGTANSSLCRHLTKARPSG